MKLKIFFLCLFIIIANPFSQLQIAGQSKTRLPESINDYSPTIVPVISFDGKILYFDRKEHPDNSGGINDYDEIWYSELKAGKYWSLANRLPFPMNTPCSDVLFSISPDGTKALIYGKEKPLSECRAEGYSIATRINNEFVKFEPLEIKEYSNSAKNYYAFLSANLDVLLLSLKNSESLGAEDIFVSFFDKITESWSKPLNLGKQINTNLDEISPVIANDGRTLYFASNGRKSYGDFDLFMSRRLDNSWTNWSEPVNLGKTINSRFKESGFSLTQMSDTAYIVSSEFELVPSNQILKEKDTIDMRHGIYKVNVPPEFQPLAYSIVKGKIYTYIGQNKESYKNRILFHIRFDDNFNHDFDYSDDMGSGEFLFVIPADTKAKISIDEPIYKPIEFEVSTKNIIKPNIIEKEFILEEKQGIQKSELTINYNVNEFTLSPLNEKKIYDLMLSTNNIKNKKISLTGHSDETGTNEYNYELSLKRANVVAEFLKNLGIPKKNITTEAKGEQSPISSDPNLNRRVEIDVK